MERKSTSSDRSGEIEESSGKKEGIQDVGLIKKDDRGDEEEDEELIRRHPV